MIFCSSLSKINELWKNDSVFNQLVCKLSEFFHSPETQKKLITVVRSGKKAIQQFFIWHQNLDFLVSSRFLLYFENIKLNTFSSPVSTQILLSSCRQVQPLLKETESHFLKPKLKLILNILAIENADHCTVFQESLELYSPWVILMEQNKVKTKAVNRYFIWRSSDMAQADRSLIVDEVRTNHVTNSIYYHK